MNNTILNKRDSELWEKYKDMLYAKEIELDAQEAFKKLKNDNHDNITAHAGENWTTEGRHGWECGESPLKVCVYNHFRDDFYDESCTYCGEPEERK